MKQNTPAFLLLIVMTLCLFVVYTMVINFENQPMDKDKSGKEGALVVGGGQFEHNTELYWQDVIQEEIGGEKEFKLNDNTRVDILLSEWACEIDWQNKWAEGVGQSIYYGLKTDKKPLVILLVRKDGWEKYRDRVEFCNITCWVFDTRIRTWLDKE